jgi:drug/metabolite transporter (DMT)-like permease
MLKQNLRRGVFMEKEIASQMGGITAATGLKQKLSSRFHAQGLTFGLLSGISYGLYSAIVGLAMLHKPFIGVVSIFAAPLVVCAINDTMAFIWLLIYNAFKGQLKEVGRSFFTFPGLMVICGALLGGPIANGAYLIGIACAGAAAIPISALCPMFGALFARIVLKQKISKRVGVGMLICIAGAVLISYVKPTGSAPNFVLGIVCAFIAAIGWGLEGGLAAFGTSMLDSNIAINIREGISGITFICVVLPIFAAFGLFGQTLSVFGTMGIIAIAALVAAFSFLTWYLGNCMVGVATGTSLNITYVMFGILFSVILLHSTISTTVIVGAVIITLGAILVSMNPLEMFKKKEA